jgi:mono/diheme cytochrome c family protein
MQLRGKFPAIGLLLLSASASAADPPNSVEFNRDIRPILSDHCFQCHGPDAAQRKGDLRLDIEPKANGENGVVIIAGQPEKSELWRRVNSTDPDERMPPPGQGRGLTKNELATLREWITSGGKFEKHWSLMPVRQPAPPQIQNSAFSIQNSLDAFIAAKLINSGLTSSPPADKPTILRRVTFGLTGLPPSIGEIETFLADNSPDAYEKTVDRLLASPRYGERMAVPWLDAARYADTSGYQSDGERHMWRWRDWVLDALNANMPFDQFTIEQIAGDLLPNATLDQKIATGFNRNHRGNAEGGIIPEEYAVEYVADRVETTSTVWLGLTLGCCRCHDHKYDPFTQRDFYSLFAFFNNVPEKGRAIKIGNSPPYIQTPTRLQTEELKARERQVKELELRVFEQFDEPDEKRVAWQKVFVAPPGLDWQPTPDLVAVVSFDRDAQEQVSRKSCRSVDGEIGFTDGAVKRAAEFDGKCCLEVGDVANFGFFDKFSIAAWVFVPEGGGGTIVSRMTDAEQSDGYQLAIVGGKLQFNLSKRWLDDALRVETAQPITNDRWHHVLAIYNGSRDAKGVELYVDHELCEKTVLLDELNQSFAASAPLRIGGGGGPAMRFRGRIDEVRVYSSDGYGQDLDTLATPKSIFDILAAKRSNSYELAKLRAFYLREHAPPEIRKAFLDFYKAEREFAAFRESLPTTMVMEELPSPRETHVLLRGQYDKPGDRVKPNTPAELPSLTTLNFEPGSLNSPPANRLDLAKWLVSEQNQLTSRVIVNRAWQLHFGTGLVKTAEDFGRQGEWPSHPDLLNHLAAEFQSNWDVKRLHRTIVTSATYRQSSAIDDLGFMIGDLKSNNDVSLNAKFPIPNHKSIDPENRLLSRGPRLRLSAEMVRDQALFASGQLVEQLGGPSVKPLQPPGLWSELTGGDDYKPGQGADLVRRSLYTFWKRTIPPPTLSTFDSPTREACTVRDSRTNTPLQALALLNEPTFVSAARDLAHRVIHEATTPTDRITRTTLYILNRRPTPPELEILTANLNRNLQRNPSDELAAYTLICTTILNLDEAITSQ